MVDEVEDKKLLLAKICFAIYGPPTVKNAKEIIDIYDGYKGKQKEDANEILKLILKIHKVNSSKRLIVGIIVIVCQQGKSEFVLPIFSVLTGGDPNNSNAKRAYVDTQRRTYDSWDDWKTNNTLPKFKYGFPRHGSFTCSKNRCYEFDVNKEPDVQFGSSPTCTFLHAFLEQQTQSQVLRHLYVVPLESPQCLH